MAKKIWLDKKKTEFAENYLKTWNATQSAKKAFNITDDNTAAVKWSRLIRSDKICAYLDDYGDVAGSRIKELIHSEKESIALEAAKYTYDQVWWKSIQKIETKNETQTININMNYNDMTPKQIQEHIKKLMWQ